VLLFLDVKVLVYIF